MIPTQKLEGRTAWEIWPYTVAGLDVGGTKSACVEGALDGTILQRIEMATRAPEHFSDTFPKIEDSLKPLVKAANQRKRAIAAISVSVCGRLKIHEGQLLNPLTCQVGSKSTSRSAWPGCFRIFPNMSNKMKMPEFHLGIGTVWLGLQHLFFLTFGTAVGAGFIVDGHILHGMIQRASSDTGIFGKMAPSVMEAGGRGILYLRCPLPAIALGADSGVLTCIGDEFGDESLFERRIGTLAESGDVAIGIRANGKSDNARRGLVMRQRRAPFPSH